MEKAKVITWKIASDRYLHEVKVDRGYFHIITDCSSFSLFTIIIRNKVLSRRSTKETRGLRKVREEREEWMGDDSWTILCFGGNDNLELRKKIYGKELKRIKLELQIYPRSGRVDMIKKDGGEDLIPGRSVLLRRNLRKRIKDPLPYITLRQRPADSGEKPVQRFYFVSELSFIQFNQKLGMWYG